MRGMDVSRAGVWRGRAATAVLAAAVLAALVPVPAAETPSVQVIVRGGGDAAGMAVGRFGGQVVAELELIDGLVARVPAGAVEALAGVPGVEAVTADTTVQLLGKPRTEDWADASLQGKPYNHGDDPGSLHNVAKAVGADDAWGHRATGQGIDVAVIDSGIAPVRGLEGRVVNGPDLSFDSQDDQLRYLDAYGHGTHLAGIIGARDPDVPAGKERESRYFVGIAPGAQLVNVKVGANDGSVDVSQVIAAIDWVVEHRNDPGLNIRVLNLAFGTDSVQDPRLDPLSYAVELAWRNGIVVVVSAGNSGTGRATLDNPATNPYVIAVGATNAMGTRNPDDDFVASFSSRGGTARRVDVVAPGASLVSLRTPGSRADLEAPGAVVADRYFRGSGTSQAAAVVSGAAALLLSDRPQLTPDQVKALLVETARPLKNGDPAGMGAGLVDVHEALHEDLPAVVQNHPRSTGTGSLQAARGTVSVDDAGVELIGEEDIFGLPWNAADWAAQAESGTAWVDGAWLGRDFTGTGWTTANGSRSWNARMWREDSWAARMWRSEDWSARMWRARMWRARMWRSDHWE